MDGNMNLRTLRTIGRGLVIGLAFLGWLIALAGFGIVLALYLDLLRI